MVLETIRTLSIRKPDDAQRLWEIYLDAFKTHRRRAIAEQQVYDEKTFKDALADEDHFKFIAKQDGQIVGFCLITNNLEKARVDYVNPNRLADLYPEEYRERRLFYFLVVAVAPAAQGGGVFLESMITAMATLISQHRGIVLFDHSTDSNPAMPKMLDGAIRRAQKQLQLPTDDTAKECLGGQQYWAVRLVKRV